MTASASAGVLVHLFVADLVLFYFTYIFCDNEFLFGNCHKVRMNV